MDRGARLCHDRCMDLEAARKDLAKRSALSPRRLAFFAVAGVALVAGLLLRAGYFGQPEGEQNAPVVIAAPPPPPAALPTTETTETVAKAPAPAEEPAAAPSPPAEPAAVAKAEQTDAAPPPADQTDLPGAGMILVSRAPVEVRASPSASAPTTYGFPAGRPFRVIGHEGGFAQIKDLKSGATGWIDEAVLVPPPRGPAVAPQPRAPSTATSQPRPAAVGGKTATPLTAAKPKAVGKGGQVAAHTGQDANTEPDPVQPERRPGLLGGVFRGIFGGGNGN
jgi:hypothetical protein